jgi:hypothetical protein
MMFSRMLVTSLLIVIAALASSLSTAGAAEKADGTVYQLRIYTTAEGRLPALHKRFADHTIDLFAKHGMENLIYTTPIDKPNTLVYLLKHKSRAAADKSWDAFRNDPVWKKAFAASRKDGAIVTKVVSQYLKMNDYSPKSIPDNKKALTYELRTYTTNKGKLPNLNARFRDHTLRIFAKHGMKNIAYFTPTDEKLQKNTLVYFIAHASPEAAGKSWKAFGGDPEWRKVAKESQVDGRILIKGGVKRQYLTPTEYSPKK